MTTEASRAYRLGRRAAEAGRPVSDNPFLAPRETVRGVVLPARPVLAERWNDGHGDMCWLMGHEPVPASGA
jgi:hypothetical protein